MSVVKGVVALTGQESLTGLGVTLTPQWNNRSGMTGWDRLCTVQDDGALKQACEEVFRFSGEQGAK
jgi:prepilin peptidase dependent protein D